MTNSSVGLKTIS